MSEGIQRSDALLERRAIRAEQSGRDWGMIGLGLAAALAVIGLYVAGFWALAVVVEALV
jgi:hypothetical protein